MPTTVRRRVFLYSLVMTTILGGTSLVRSEDKGWKAGTAKTVMTPTRPVWMAGYASRDKPAQDKEHDLYIRAVALEDAKGHRAVVVSTDTVGVPRTIYENTVKVAAQKFGLDRSQIMLNCSHTHCGPVLRMALFDAYPLDDAQKKLIEQYSVEFESKIIETIGNAISKLAPAKLSSGQGMTDFAVNRRNNPEKDVPEIRKRGALKGPSDHAVPVLAVHTPDGKLVAVVFGYACHNTTLDYYKWCGDYAGFAQLNLEEAHPGATALFYMGCGADQNPIPRRTLELAKKYGGMLSGAVDTVLSKSMQPLEPTLRTEFEMITLNLGTPPTREELQKLAAGDPNYIQRWASRHLKALQAGQAFEKTYPYPVQAWLLGGKQLWISLGGEVVVDYSLALKKALGNEIWVTGYANDVMAYIPSLRVLDEGGYEGNTSMIVYGMPAARWAPDIEELVTSAALKLAKKVRE